MKTYICIEDDTGCKIEEGTIEQVEAELEHYVTHRNKHDRTFCVYNKNDKWNEAYSYLGSVRQGKYAD